MHRVFVTGIGVVSPIGNDRTAFWEALCAGRSGIRTLENVDLTDLAITIGGQVQDLDASWVGDSEKISVRRMDRATLFSLVAAREALADAGLPQGQLGERYGVVIGCGLSGIHTIHVQTENLIARGPRGVSVLTIPVLMPNAAAANITLAFDVTGPAYSVNSACSSSGHAIIDAYEMLRRGAVDVVLAGGTESAITRLGLASFANMKAMTKRYNDRPAEASRPFDADRDGFIMSEGAGVLILETEEHLRRRGRQPYLEILGYGSTMDAHHLVQPDAEAKGAIRAIANALAMAGLDPAAIARETYVNAHGTSTKLNDAAETLALKTVFGKSAYELQISSTKSETGHLIGAACAVEMVACALAVRERTLPPTINYHTKDPQCDLDYVPNRARPAEVRFCLKNSFGFGGHNVCLVAGRPA